jgi:hypothetical protein
LIARTRRRHEFGCVTAVLISRGDTPARRFLGVVAAFTLAQPVGGTRRTTPVARYGKRAAVRSASTPSQLRVTSFASKSHLVDGHPLYVSARAAPHVRTSHYGPRLPHDSKHYDHGPKIATDWQTRSAGGKEFTSSGRTLVIARSTRGDSERQTFGPNQVLVGHVACLGHGGGHTSWHCRTCDAAVYGPPLNVHCTCLDGPAAVRIFSGRE